MRFLFKFVFLIGLLLLGLYLASPYYAIHQLDEALRKDDQEVMATWVDLDSIRRVHKEVLQYQVQRRLGAMAPPGSVPPPGRAAAEPNGDGLSGMLRDGAELLGNVAVDVTVNMDWVRESLRPRTETRGDHYPSLVKHVSFGFFESPGKFLARIGELGKRPVHFHMDWQPWNWPESNWGDWFWRDGLHRWKVTAIYG